MTYFGAIPPRLDEVKDLHVSFVSSYDGRELKLQQHKALVYYKTRSSFSPTWFGQRWQLQLAIEVDEEPFTLRQTQTVANLLRQFEHARVVVWQTSWLLPSFFYMSRLPHVVHEQGCLERGGE